MGSALKNFLDANKEVKVDPSQTGDGGVNRETTTTKEQESAASTSTGDTVKQEDVQEIDFSKIPEDKLLGYLAGKVGRQLGKWEDLVVEKEVVKEVEKPYQFAAPDIEVIDKFVRETGRGVDDYFKAQKNWDDVPDDKVVLEYMKSKPKFKGLDDESLQILFDESYGMEKVTEDMDEEEIAKIERANKIKQARLKVSSTEARDYFNSQKEQYKTPLKQVEDKVDEGRKLWSENMKNALSNVTKIETEDFVYEFRDRDNYDKTFTDIDSLMGSFKKEDGSLDYGSLAKTIIAGRELTKILEEHAKAVRANTIEAEMKKKSNAGGEIKQSPDGTGDNGEAAVRASLRKAGFKV